MTETVKVNVQRGRVALMIKCEVGLPAVALLSGEEARAVSLELNAAADDFEALEKTRKSEVVQNLFEGLAESFENIRDDARNLVKLLAPHGDRYEQIAQQAERSLRELFDPKEQSNG